MDAKIKQIGDMVDAATDIVVVQADNPDGDSLSSSLALEQILGDLGKNVIMFCGVDIPSYLQYLSGWDRVMKELPNKFDLGIIVDASNDSLLEQLELTEQKPYLKTKPTIILDHHSTESDITWSTLNYKDDSLSTTELIYKLAKQLKWKMSLETMELLATGMLSDSLGLTTDAVVADNLRIMAELLDGGVSLAKLENRRRSTLSRDPELVHYKGALLQRVEYHDDNRIALVSIPWEEIEKYSPIYNPSMLVIDDMRLATGTAVAVSFKIYDKGRITGKIRCNWGFPVGAKLAEHFGGGGHPYAAGFKITDGRSYDEVKSEFIKTATKLLDEIKES